MYKFIILIVLVLGTSCNSGKQQPQMAFASIEVDAPVFGPQLKTVEKKAIVTTDLYELKLEINPLKNDIHDLVINMKLKNDSYYVSPNSKGDFTGIFSLVIKDEGHIEQITKLIETPLSVEEYDPHPFVNGPVNWVRENTTYNQQLQVKSQSNFLVSGVIQFTIEPKCTLEKIPFIIYYQEGKMRIALGGKY